VAEAASPKRGLTVLSSEARLGLPALSPIRRRVLEPGRWAVILAAMKRP
jgi:hypothetical protein